MSLMLYTRRDLVEPTAERQQSRVLLEGSWPTADRTATCVGLDASLDGRFDWIDGRAAELAEQVAAMGGRNDSEPIAGSVSLAHLDALSLRYYLVKLLRPVVYFTQLRPLTRRDDVTLIAGAGRDEDYAAVLAQVCAAAGAAFRVQRRPQSMRSKSLPPNRLWRRLLSGLTGVVEPTTEPRDDMPKVVLCGNPRLLDPVCRELLRRRCRLWWLYDRFAVRAWLQWQSAGVGQLVCNSSLGRENQLVADVPGPIPFEGVDLAEPLGRWMAGRAGSHGPRYTRLTEQIDAHFARVKPEVVVLDEDATPTARAAAVAARRHGARTLVVQHGAPYCQFGFMPAAADRFLAWGAATRDRLVGWGAEPERVRVVGAVQGDALPPRLTVQQPPNKPGTGTSRQSAHAGPTLSRSEPVPALLGTPREPRPAVDPPRILLLATVPPRDDRPDAVSMNLTTETYAEMLRMAWATVAGIDDAELIVKLHPRSGNDPSVRRVCRDYPQVRTRLVRRGGPRRWFERVDCVLSCVSSAGVEAAAAGLPVVQLAPPGSTAALPDEAWAMAGTARSESELQQLLAKVLVEGWRPEPRAIGNVFAPGPNTAARRIADEVVAAAGQAEPEQAPASAARVLSAA